MSAPERIDVVAAKRALLARMLRGEATPDPLALAPEPIRLRASDVVVPLTAEQRQLWLHAAMAPDMPLYNESITIHRHGPYHHAAIEAALTEFVRRHALWRTAFVEVDGEPVQHIADPMALSLPIVDISDLAPEPREAEAARLATQDARRPIPLDQAPLFRARIVRMGPEEHRLYLTLHHIIFDGVSIYRTLVPELARLVTAYEAALPSPLPEPALDYADYAVWQAGAAAPVERARQLDYWRTQLVEPLPRLELAGDRPRPVLPSHAGSMEVFTLDHALVEALKAVARAEGATLYMVLLAAYKTMLFRYTGDEDLIVGGVTDTRRRPELQPIVGYFLNTFALRSRPTGGLPFRAYLRQVKASVLGALGASDVPFDRLMRALDIKRGQGTHPLFNTLFSIEPPVDPFPPGWDLTQMDVVVGAAKYDLYLELDERHDGMAGRFLYSTELFDPATIRRMIGHWTSLLKGIAADVGTPLARLPMLEADERRTLIETWNDTVRAVHWPSVVDWFAARAAAGPDSIAIEQGRTRWSYEELSRHADTVAAQLVAAGVGAGDLVGLSLDRSPWMVAAILGVARIGAAYLPLDPGFPPARLRQIIASAQPSVLLVEADTAPALGDSDATLVRLDRTRGGTPPTPLPIDGETLAYVLYTSGSTGVPKGVEVPHAALVNLLSAMQAEPGFAPGERLLAITTLSFDIAGLELWLPLVSGGTIVLATRAQATDMAALAALIDRTRPDLLQATPATWRGLIEAGWTDAPGMRALCGGESLPRALADQLAPRVASLWNMYGPTETTIWSTTARVDDGPITIGRPIGNTQIRVLDDDGNDRPIGAVGELHIGGRGLARGYRAAADLTAERFVQHDGARLYRTGDLARWRADGRLECLGRTDQEEKVRGFRIAIEEVEGALAGLPGVRAAAVRAWPDPSGERALACYLVGEGDVTAWRERLATLLPDYMVPTRWVRLDALPLTPNGKVDRRALPDPGAATSHGSTSPATPAEERLAAHWRAVLKVERVAREDDFFDLGGHSLLIARLLRRIETDYGTRLPMTALFRAPRLADMAALIASGRPIESPALAPIQSTGTKPPIIWLDGGSTFRPLAERLGQDQPFYGFSVDYVLEQTGGCPATLEDAADLVAAAIREARPAGPYLLGGWCTSGILAYAVATRLRAEGQEVPLLMLAHAYEPSRARRIGAARLFVSKLRFHVAQSLAQPKGARARYFLHRLHGLSDGKLVGGSEAILQPELRRALDAVATEYTPPAYDGDVLLIQPAEHPHVLDFAADWRALVTGRFWPMTAPGGHRTMLEPPHVDAIAVRVRELLATA